MGHDDLPLTPDSLVAARPDRLFATVGSDVIVYDPTLGRYYDLNGAGARIWQLIQTPRAVRSLCEILAGEFDISLQRCDSDVRELLDDMRSNGLIEIRNLDGDSDRAGGDT